MEFTFDSLREVLWFQVPWGEANLLIVLIAAFIYFYFGFLVINFVYDVWDKILGQDEATLKKKQREIKIREFYKEQNRRK